MTAYPHTARQQPIGYAPGYEIDPEQEDAIFADPSGAMPESTVRRKKQLQVIRRGNHLLIVQPPVTNKEGEPRYPVQHRRHVSTAPHSTQTNQQRVPRRATGAYDQRIARQETEALLLMHPGRTRSAPHWLLPTGVGAAAMLTIYLGGTLFFGWLHSTLDDLRYGNPRTYQTDAQVGHDDQGTPSHFLTLNLNRHVEIVEWPGSDPSHAHIYQGPTLTGEGQENTPITLTFRDLNHDGKLDMVVSIQNAQVVFLNTGSAFRPATPADHLTQ